MRFVALLALMLTVCVPAFARDLLPPFSFEDAQGRTLTLADYRGKVVLLDFWASWCAPCVQEIPALDRLQRAYRDKGLVVLPVSIDRSGLAKVQLFYRLHDIKDLPALMDDERKAVQALGIDAIPASYLIGRDGGLVAGFTGPHDWEADASLIERTLAE